MWIEALAVNCVMAAIGIILYRLHKRCCRKGSYDNTGYSIANEAAIGMTIAGLVWGLFELFTIAYTIESVTALANPEYWALKQVLETLK